MKNKVRVLVIDDSAVMRQLLTAVLNSDPGIEVVGTAPDAAIAENKIKVLRPDVLTLDVEMPGMNGIAFLEKIMRTAPMPVVMISSLTKRGADVTLRALEIGAIDFVTKPDSDLRNGIDDLVYEIRSKIHAAALAHVHATPDKKQSDFKQVPGFEPPARPADRLVIAIGASAGGTQAIQEVLYRLPSKMPGIVIVQHMPARFTALFADRINSKCGLNVKEAQDGDELTAGTVLIAPGGMQMQLVRTRTGYGVSVYHDDKVSLHRPCVDVLFDSVARTVGKHALGVILTGMGKDGALGIDAMRKEGAYTIAQDKETCVVFGMPAQAIEIGAIKEVLPIYNVPEGIMRWAIKNSSDFNDLRITH